MQDGDATTWRIERFTDEGWHPEITEEEEARHSINDLENNPDETLACLYNYFPQLANWLQEHKAFMEGRKLQVKKEFIVNEIQDKLDDKNITDEAFNEILLREVGIAENYQNYLRNSPAGELDTRKDLIDAIIENIE